MKLDVDFNLIEQLERILDERGTTILGELDMNSTIIPTLYNSRHYDRENKKYYFDSPLVDLVKALEGKCKRHGLTLSRWQYNMSGRRVSIKYAIHSGPRADQLRRMENDSVLSWIELDQLEGTGPRCKAYYGYTPYSLGAIPVAPNPFS